MERKRIFEPKNFELLREKYHQGWIMPYTHYHDSYELYILEYGERIVTINGIEYTVGERDVTLFDKNVPHTSRGTTPYSGICLHTVDRYIDHYFTSAAKQQLLKCFNQPIIKLNEEEFETIKNMTDNFIVNAVNNFVLLADILTIMNTAATRIHPTMLSADTNISRSKTDMVLKYVNENYMFIRNISEIMNMFDVSESFVFKLFKKQYGITPKHYINELRLQNVRHLLETTDDTVKSIAFNSGFDSYEYFMRVFRKSHNCTPSEYRKMNSGTFFDL